MRKLFTILSHCENKPLNKGFAFCFENFYGFFNMKFQSKILKVSKTFLIHFQMSDLPGVLIAHLFYFLSNLTLCAWVIATAIASVISNGLISFVIPKICFTINAT